MNDNYKIETYYLDNDNNIVEPEKATRGVIRELDEDGNLISETWGTFSNEPIISDDEFDDYISKLEKEENNIGNK